ncbi:MAG: FkbM family methyltransferase, partial [Silvanigrellaceae bacterium]|nr:FkbM family methyltransferase [Silvanigrellaceae bacterium]
EFYYHFSGSLLQPIDTRRAFLYGPPYTVPTYNFLDFCKTKKLSKIHVIYLDCGGNELSVLKSIEEYLKDGIVVFLKTYHQQVRTGISGFQQIDHLMIKQGYELFSHYVYDDVIGDALYVKSNYVSAVFRSKEL